MRCRHTCVLLAATMILSPVAALRAQETAAIGKSHLTSQSVAAVSLRPKQVLTNPANALLPIEVAKAAGEKYLGMDAANIEQAVAVIEAPMGMNVFYAVFLRADQPWNLDRLAPDLTAHAQPGEVMGRECLVSAHPALPCLMVLNDNLLVVATQGMLEKLMGENRGQADSVLVDLVTNHTAADDLYVAVDLEQLRPLISLGMMQAAQEMPPEFQKFLEIPDLLQSAELTLTLDGSQPSQLTAHAANESDATKLAGLLEEGIKLARQQMLAEMQSQMAELRSSGDPVQVATAGYMERMSGVYLDFFRPKQDGNSFVLFNSEQYGAGQMSSVAVIGVLVALLLPAVQAAREAARRNMSMNNQKQLMLALLNYEAVHGHLPPHAIYSDDGKPLLSWRVAILPFVEGEGQLSERFRLDEPWDSEHNKQLIPLMPAVFSSPNSMLDPTEGKANYAAPVADGNLFDGTANGAKFRDVTDGTANTIALVELADDASPPWTQPVDWKYDDEQPFKGLALRPGGVFLAAFSDGHITSIDTMIDPSVFEALLTRSGGETVDAP